MASFFFFLFLFFFFFCLFLFVVVAFSPNMLFYVSSDDKNIYRIRAKFEIEEFGSSVDYLHVLVGYKYYFHQSIIIINLLNEPRAIYYLLLASPL